jgi:N-acyl amino acid synthase of PEP-CTERM/exosortase system
MKLFRSFPALKNISSAYKQYKETRATATVFGNYFSPILATSKVEKEHAFAIRHNVYCDELGLEPVRENGLETDIYDRYAKHSLMHHKKTGQLSGTVRIIAPRKESETLPIEDFCEGSISHPTLKPSNFPRETICEISRLAIPKGFRRSSVARMKGKDNEPLTAEEKTACSMIAIGLYFTAAATALQEGRYNAFVMIEPRLARAMALVGVKFKQIGPVVDYHGKRAPFYISGESLRKNLKPTFVKMFANIEQKIGEDSVSPALVRDDWGKNPALKKAL